MKSLQQILICAGVLLAFTGCRKDQFVQPKSNPLAVNNFYKDDAASQPLPDHVVAHDDLSPDQSFATGAIGTNPLTAFPFSITRDVLERGKERYDIACAPCHGFTGEGDGMVVQRGFPAPPSYGIQRLREAPVGHFVNVMARGYGIMYPQAERVKPEDRWAIAAYIRALQLSQSAPLADVPLGEKTQLTAMP